MPTLQQPSSYAYQEFPKWKYHPDKEPLVVDDADAERLLGSDWYDTPSEAKAALERMKETVIAGMKQALNDSK